MSAEPAGTRSNSRQVVRVVHWELRVIERTSAAETNRVFDRSSDVGDALSRHRASRPIPSVRFGKTSRLRARITSGTRKELGESPRHEVKPGVMPLARGVFLGLFAARVCTRRWARRCQLLYSSLSPPAPSVSPFCKEIRRSDPRHSVGLWCSHPYPGPSRPPLSARSWLPSGRVTRRVATLEPEEAALCSFRRETTARVNGALSAPRGPSKASP